MSETTNTTDTTNTTYKQFLDKDGLVAFWNKVMSTVTDIITSRVDDINDMLPIEKGTGDNSIVQKGSNNIATGNISHAEGKGTQAKGHASHTEGWYTIANNESEHASGIFNISTKSSNKSDATQFSIGIGTSDTNRKNAFEVKQNGDIYVDGVEGRIQDRLNIDLLVPIEHSDLKKLRDSNQLIPGQKYRITDYITTTTQENTTSALHPFDLIVTALDNHTLSENASAIKSDRDGDGDGYFGTENVEAWQLKYCLDNDTERFAWADTENGKGVIYRMIDEYGNDCPYDFKNIMFKHPKDTATYPGYYYTFTTLVSDVVSDHSFSAYCYNNVIKEYKYAIFSTDEGKYKYSNSLNKNVFINTAPTSICYGNSFGNNCYSNSFGSGCYNNSFGSGCYDNSFGNGCSGNSFGNYCNSNSFGNSCASNSFGSGCYYNSFGNDCFENHFLGECNYNSFGAECYNNSFGNYCSRNSFENNCNYNSFGAECYNNSFGNDCYGNSFGNYCYGNSFGNYCYYNSFRISASKDDTLLNYCYYNHFDDGCGYNVIWNSVQPTLSNKLQNIHVVRGVSGTASAYNFINVVDKNTAYEIKVAKNSSGEIKVYCEADLIA